MAEIDIATLGIKIDASGADKAEHQLDNLAKSADRAENSARGVSSATREMKTLMAQAIAAINSNTQALGSNTDQLNRNKTASNGAANAADSMENRVNRLRSSIDPMGTAISRVNTELAEARMLFEAGAMSANDYARAQTVLNARIGEFHRRQGMMNTAMGIGARSAKFQAHEVLNLSRQFADIGVTAAMGMNPLMILIQQGPQIADVLGTARARGMGVADMFRNIYDMSKPFFKIIGTLGTVATIAFGALSLGAREASKNLGDVQRELGLSEKQMDRLKDKGTELGYTMGDTMAGIGAGLAYAFSFDKLIDGWNNLLDDMSGGALSFIEDIVGWFGGMTNAIKVFFSDVPRSVGAVLISTLKLVITAINDMLARGTRVINNFLNMLPSWAGVRGDLKAPSITNTDNPLQGQMNALTGAFAEGREGAVGAFRQGRGRHRRDRILEDAGDGDKSRSSRPRKSGEERDWERELQGAQEFIKALREQTEEIGKNELELKRLNTTRAQAALKEAAHKAALAGVNVDMKQVLNLTLQMAQAQEAWEQAWNTNAIEEMRRELSEQADALKFEQELIGLNNEERARAIALRDINLKIMDAEKKGHWGLAEALRDETNAILDLVGAKGQGEDRADAANRAAVATRDMANAVREATESFGELFGTAGEGYANLMNTIFDFNASQQESMAELIDLQREYNEGKMSAAEYAFEHSRVEQDMAQKQVALYGNMLSAAKTFFKEGSTGWRIMEAAERAYRLFQFAMTIKSMILGKAETASSVANSGAKATADGIAGVAKAIASLPFPLNIAAGAATLAFLVAIGVKMFGKGGGGGAASAASSAASRASDAYSGPVDEYGAPTSYYSVLRPGHTNVAGTWSNGASASGMGGGVNIGDTTLIVQGSLDSATIPQVQEMLDQNRQVTIEEARSVVARDSAERNSRYNIGG